jgi:hypothetical protein
VCACVRVCVREREGGREGETERNHTNTLPQLKGPRRVHVSECVCVCVRVCVRARERDSDEQTGRQTDKTQTHHTHTYHTHTHTRHTHTHKSPQLKERRICAHALFCEPGSSCTAEPYVSIRQHTRYIYISIRQHTVVLVLQSQRQHTSAYALYIYISACFSIRAIYLQLQRHTSAYVSIRAIYVSSYVSIRAIYQSSLPQLRQRVHFCTSKASKVRRSEQPASQCPFKRIRNTIYSAHADVC